MDKKQNWGKLVRRHLWNAFLKFGSAFIGKFLDISGSIEGGRSIQAQTIGKDIEIDSLVSGWDWFEGAGFNKLFDLGKELFGKLVAFMEINLLDSGQGRRGDDLNSIGFKKSFLKSFDQFGLLFIKIWKFGQKESNGVDLGLVFGFYNGSKVRDDTIWELNEGGLGSSPRIGGQLSWNFNIKILIYKIDTLLEIEVLVCKMTH